MLATSFGYDVNNTGNLNSLTLTGSAGTENTSWVFDANTGSLNYQQYADGSQDKTLYNLAGNPAGMSHPAMGSWTRKVTAEGGRDFRR